MITKENEAARYNEGKAMLSLIDYRMFCRMHEEAEYEINKCSNIVDCISQIIYNTSEVTAPENAYNVEPYLYRLQFDCYALSALQLLEPFNSSKVLNLKVFEPMAHVLEYGIQKYSRNNWRKGYINKFSSADSLLRHVSRIVTGENNDEESGLPHIGHIMCNVMFLTNDLLYVKRETN